MVSGSIWAKRATAKVLSLGLLLGGLPFAARPFSGEDFLQGNPWHHEAISEDALRAKGFSEQALDEIAWHADYVDSYLYNPLWWVQGGLSRYKVAMAGYNDLARVHFDDNFSAAHVQRTFRRYLSGCLAGLVWAAERNNVSGARNLVGISLHAMQDFYSHSNWIDAPERRLRTWFEVPKATRDKTAIYIGAYEKDVALGVKHHGKITPACTILRQGAVKVFLEPGCSAFSPLHNHKVCAYFDECKNGTPIQPKLHGITVPNSVLYASPPGINVDAKWIADIGVRERGLTDITGEQAFNTARGLAERASEQWLGIIEEKLNALGHGPFWTKVKSQGTTNTKETEYENYSKFPFQFITAGTYPPDLAKPEEEYYLRVLLRTADVANAGTDSDIYLEANGQRFMLDYLPRVNPVIAYNDLERNDLQVYTVGPFASMPTQISLYNDAANAGDVLASLGQSFLNSITSLVDSIGSFLLSLVGGHADKVGGTKRTFSPSELRNLTSNWTHFNLTVNGGDEGKFRLECSIRKVGELPGDDRDAWAEYSVLVRQLVCEAESDWDRGSNSDEPYVLSLAVPLPGTVHKRLFGPFNDVDKNESRAINYTFPTMRVNKHYGMVSVPIAVWESDDESASSRQQQLDKFAGEADSKTNDEERGFTDTLGAAIAADWKVGSMEVYAFNRGGTVLKAGSVYSGTPNAWVEGKKRVNFNLNVAGLKSYPAVNSHQLDSIGIKLTLPPGGIIRPPGRIIPPPIHFLW